MFLLSLLAACAGSPDDVVGDSDSGAADSGDSGDSGDTGGTDSGDTGEPCAPQGTFACPIALTLPASVTGDTATNVSDVADAYACAPTTDESGPELVYTVQIAQAGILTVDMTAGNSGGVDVDVHVLSAADASSCVARDHERTAWVVQPGTWYVVADSWNGAAQAGAFAMQVDFRPLPTGSCAMENRELRMFWQECAPGIDCRVDGDVLLNTPSVGPVVMEAHLVTEEEWSGTWPTSFTDGIAAHYALSASVSGYSTTRDQPWAPAGEGGSEYGQGATGAPVPAAAEAWYVNMYWRDRPSRGHRILVLDPYTGQAVVAAGGYETGPGSNEAIGGAVEEIHRALGTGHRDDLIMGYLVDQSLDYGPVSCSF
ncbi:MAG: hypothetical protein EP330_13185 [Deltaproteobacteria bacterium]|nr:MAG: hypothetical protein EP330_13185 [Deltaproteobacteria bacterium]